MISSDASTLVGLPPPLRGRVAGERGMPHGEASPKAHNTKGKL